MTGSYAYTPDIWPSLAGVLLTAAMALYGWRHRRVPGAPPLVAAMLAGIVLLSGIAFKTAAATPVTRIAWSKFQDVWLVPATTAGTCFVLQYVFPGRWLTRRTLSVLALPSLLALVLAVVNDGRLVWRQVEIGADGSVAATFATAGAIMTAYAVGLGLVNAAALLWLYLRSPLHRWPAAIMLLGQIGARGLFLLGFVSPPLLPSIDLVVLAVLSPTMGYTIALFGFRILDPLPAARQMTLEQMREGLVVFDTQWRVVSLNPAAETILSTPVARARRRTLAELLPAFPDLSAPLAEAGAEPSDISLGTGHDARLYAPRLSPLHDFRGLLIGRLLTLRDVTAQRQAQAQIIEQQRALATLQERERLAHELHDSLGQILGYASLQVEAAAKLSRDGRGATAAAQLDRLGGVIRDAHADVREYILDLRSAPSPQEPFYAVLQRYLGGFTDNYGIQTRLTVAPELAEQPFAPDAQLQVLRIVQEALSNARKHSQARQVQVTLVADKGRLCVTIEDDGCGFAPGEAAAGGQHFGLQFMQERAAQLGGSLQVQSAPGAGTRVILRVPDALMQSRKA